MVWWGEFVEWDIVMRFLTACAATALAASTAFAQDRPNTILVMDGSGSMWGQIDGVAKITIAQDVVGDLLESIPTERGNCTDIETVVAPAPTPLTQSALPSPASNRWARNR